MISLSGPPIMQGSRQHDSQDSMTEEGADRMYKPENREECCEMLSSGQNLDVTLTALYQLWIPV